MDKRTAARYLDTLYGRAVGHVAVAYKDRGESWQEQTFAWPKDRTKLLAWADIHADANIFICPALRESPVRAKGNGKNMRWLWADVDMDKVPADQRDEVNRRINDLATFTVASGSGENRHVYVKLDASLDPVDHLRLNTGLRNYLYADNKHTDNSLLRLPGTTNWKTEAGSPVHVITENSRTTPASELLAIRAFSQVKVTAVGSTDVQWTEAMPEGISRRVRAMVQMTPEEAVARYGSRHKAVWAIAGELHKRGFTPDEVHTLMDAFPPAEDKRAEEHGAYDVHKDVEKRLIWDRANIPELSEEDMEELEDAVMDMEDATDQDFEREVQERIERMAVSFYERNLAHQRAKLIEAERTWIAPPDDVSWSLTGVLNDPPAAAQYLIGAPRDGKRGLCGVKHNVIITAQFKTGKTKFVVASVIKSLADGVDFLGSVPVHTPEGGVVVGHWNCEMDPDEMASEYVIPAQIKNSGNVVGANLRGFRVNILSDHGKQWAIQWLKDRQVKVWTIDSLARLARMAGVSEKENDEMFDLLMALDEIKLAAGVDVIFLITHTGREKHEVGKERARGATAIDDWCDARWIMTDEGGTRFLAVDGRGVGMDAAPLIYDQETGSSTLGFGGREEAKADGAVQTVLRVVQSQPGITKKALIDVLRPAMKIGMRAAEQYIEDAIEAGFIEVNMDGGGRGRAAMRHYAAGGGSAEGDRTRRATPGVVDMRAARKPTRRRTADVH